MKIILIVEDYEDTRELMKFLLEADGYEVIEAADGNQAVAQFETAHPDLILMDISMPEMDGIEATRLIRASGDGITETPIIVVTAFDEDIQQKALAAGCNEVIPKPIVLNELEDVVKKYLPQA